MTNKRVPVERRLEVVRFYRDHQFSLIETAKRFGVSKRSLIRWMHEYAPEMRFVSFVPIEIKQSGRRSGNEPSKPLIPVAITTGNGSTLHFHLHSFDEIAALVRSLKNHAEPSAQCQIPACRTTDQHDIVLRRAHRTDS